MCVSCRGALLLADSVWTTNELFDTRWINGWFKLSRCSLTFFGNGKVSKALLLSWMGAGFKVAEAESLMALWMCLNESACVRLGKSTAVASMIHIIAQQMHSYVYTFILSARPCPAFLHCYALLERAFPLAAAAPSDKTSKVWALFPNSYGINSFYIQVFTLRSCRSGKERSHVTTVSTLHFLTLRCIVLGQNLPTPFTGARSIPIACSAIDTYTWTSSLHQTIITTFDNNTSAVATRLFLCTRISVNVSLSACMRSACVATSPIPLLLLRDFSVHSHQC